MVQNGPNGQTRSKMVEMVKYGKKKSSKWAKMVQNGKTWSKIVLKNGQNGLKWAKIGQNWSKW